jgi:hypothetical protein
VKIQNSEDEKYFKDITLNNILNEISQETSGETSQKTAHETFLDNETFYTKPIPYETENNSQIKFYLQLIFLGILPLLLLIFFFMPSKQKTALPQIAQTSISPVIHKKSPSERKEKLPDTRIVPKQLEQPKTIEVVVQKKDPERKIDSKRVREKAKKDLLNQMKTK